MNKYLVSTLAGTFVMLMVSIIYMFLEMPILGQDAYMNELFIDWTANMGVFFLGLIGVKLFHAFVLSYLHEKLARCNSSLFEKTWRFTLFAFFLVYGTGLLMTWLTMPVEPLMILSWAVSGLLQTFFGSMIIIYILYKYPASDLTCGLNTKK